MKYRARLGQLRRRNHRITHRRGTRPPGLSLEWLEPRTLMAGDVVGTLCTSGDSEADMSLVESQLDASELSASSVQAADAGSTFGTAKDLGELSGEQSFFGSVGRRDPADVVRFTLAAEADVMIQLSRLRSDIDLALYDQSGRRIAVSNRAGSASESISLTLESGVYYIGITPWRRASSSYVLTTNVALTPPPLPDPIDTPDPTDPPETIDSPATIDTSDPDDTSEPGGAVTEFSDVAYYGGSNEWNLNAINAPESWAEGYTGEGVTVAVIDSGVDIDHADLVNQIWINPGEVPGNGIDDDQNGFVDDVHGWDFISNDNVAEDGNGHGTHVAGTIAAEQNGFGATGVAPGATIMPVRVLNNDGYGTDNAVAAGIRYAAENGADIINLSLGGTFSFVIQSAIRFAEQLDVLVVAAAGNEYAAAPSYPARFSVTTSNVISVGAHTISDRIAGFSNDVGSSDAVQVDAPGVSVFSTYPGGRYATLSGTSMAAPHVAGLAALALSANNDLTASQLRELIVAGANRTVTGSDSQGGINAAVTVALASAGQTADVAAVSATVSVVSTQSFFAQASRVTNTTSPAGPAQTGSHRTPAPDTTQGTAPAMTERSAEAAFSSTLHDHALEVLLSSDATSVEADEADEDDEASFADLLAASVLERFARTTALGEALSEDWLATTASLTLR